MHVDATVRKRKLETLSHRQRRYKVCQSGAFSRHSNFICDTDSMNLAAEATKLEWASSL